MTDERIEKMNEWLKTTISIGTERVSCEIEGDYLTKWDEDSYHEVHYVDGRVDKAPVLNWLVKQEDIDYLQNLCDKLNVWPDRENKLNKLGI
jgi:hypothetical protein